MTSIKKAASGFYEWEAEPRFKQPHAIGVGRKAADCLAHYNAVGARGLFGNPSFGFGGKDLDFLRLAKKKPTWLWFWDVELTNIDALYELDEIDYLGINPKRPGIDFSRFSRLDHVINEWLKDDSGLARANISEYHLWRFNPKSKSFADSEIPRNVKRLELYWANPATLDGLPVMPKLKELRIHRCRNLVDLSALPQIAPKLEHLLSTSSKKIVPKAGIIDHPTLKTARIDGKEHLATT